MFDALRRRGNDRPISPIAVRWESTRTSKDAMEYKVTVDDPAAYTKPFTGGFELRFRPTNELFEYMCQQANYAHELMVGRDATDKKISRTSPIVP